MNHGEPVPSTDSKKPVARPPTNLRFQRRTSERAFYETSLRDSAMDYSGAGTSPWASSPDASRTSFGDVAKSDAPSAVPQQQGQDVDGSTHTANGEANQNQSHAQGQGSSWSAEQQHQWEQQQRERQQQQSDSLQQRGQGEETRRPQSARYHGTPPQQRQHVPQHRLQMKITGLERSGKKDPILKFDAYVRCRCRCGRLLHADSLQDKLAQVPDNAVPRHSPYPP